MTISRQISSDGNISVPDCQSLHPQYSDVIMSTMASQITSLPIVYTTVHSGADQRKHQNSASLAFVRGIHRWPVNSPHKRPVTRKMFPFDDVVMWKRIVRRQFRLFSSNVVRCFVCVLCYFRLYNISFINDKSRIILQLFSPVIYLNTR